MLAKSLGISQLIYSASMLSVPKPVINQTQGKLFASTKVEAFGRTDTFFM